MAFSLFSLLALCLWLTLRGGSEKSGGSQTYSARSGRMSQTYTTDSRPGQSENESETPDSDEEER